MWLIILLVIVAVGALAWTNRTKVLAKILGQSEARVDRHLNRRR